MSFYYGNTIHLLFSLRSFRKHRKSSSTLNVQLKSVAKILFSVILFFPPIQKVIRGFNDLATLNPRLAKEWHPTKNGDVTPYDVTTGSRKKAWWLCPLGHEYTATIRDRNSDNTQCPKCLSYVMVIIAHILDR